MTRRTIQERYARLEARGAELAGEPMPPGLSPIHVRTVDVLGDFMALGDRLSAGGEVHPMVKTLMQLLKRTRPLILEQLAGVPAAEIRGFVEEIRAKLATITEGEGGGHDDSTGTAGELAGDVERPASA